MERAVEYDRERLGFRCELYGDPPNFCTTGREGASIFLALGSRPERIVPNWRLVHDMWDAYISVEGVDALYAELQERRARIDYTIYDAPHGFREFGTQDPTGTTSASASQSGAGPRLRSGGLLSGAPRQGQGSSHDQCHGQVRSFATTGSPAVDLP
jgi:hypothetical protein